jgi:hypothetical protein
MNKKQEKKACQQDRSMHEPDEEEAARLLFDEMITPDLHPDERAGRLYEKMRERLGFGPDDETGINKSQV